MAKIIEQTIENIHYIRLPKTLESAENKSLMGMIDAWVAKKVEVFVLDFRDTLKISDECAIFFLEFTYRAHSSSQKVAAINLTDVAKIFFKAHQLDKHFSTLEQTRDKPTEDSQAIDQIPLQDDLIHYLTHSGLEELSTFLGRTVKVINKSNADEIQSVVEDSEFISCIRLEVAKKCMSIRLYFCRTAVLELAMATMGATMSKEELDDNMILESVANEALNIIYGRSKSIINEEKGYRFPGLIPVSLNQDHCREELKLKYDRQQLFTLGCENSQFTLEVTFR